MADLIYTAEGRPQGFRLNHHIFDLAGTPVGKVFAEKAYSLAGTYIGAIVNNMVLDKPGLSRRSLPPSPAPPNATPPAMGRRRPVCERFADCFPDLAAGPFPVEELPEQILR